jgi:hypothetical protein
VAVGSLGQPGYASGVDPAQIRVSMADGQGLAAV